MTRASNDSICQKTIVPWLSTKGVFINYVTQPLMPFESQTFLKVQAAGQFAGGIWYLFFPPLQESTHHPYLI